MRRRRQVHLGIGQAARGTTAPAPRSPDGDGQMAKAAADAPPLPTAGQACPSAKEMLGGGCDAALERSRVSRQEGSGEAQLRCLPSLTP